MIREEMDDDGYWVTVEGDGEVAECVVCAEAIWWQSCPTGGWWVHERHPADGHDAVDFVELQTRAARATAWLRMHPPAVWPTDWAT